jgi:acyl-CoA synthetase (AMP-forming)/AMP-acid ligase II/serine acetyltransferase
MTDAEPAEAFRRPADAAPATVAGDDSGRTVPTEAGAGFWSRLERFGDAIALVEDDVALRYIELAARADQWIADTRELLPDTIDRPLAAIEIASTIPAIIAYLGCLRAGWPVILLPAGRAAQSTGIEDVYRPNVVVRSIEKTIETRFAARTPCALQAELAVLLSTSGTTGAVKLVRLARSNVEANATSIVEYLGVRTTDVAVTTLPLHYSYGMSVLHSHLAAGARLVLTDHGVLEDEFWRTAREQGVTSLALVPTQFELLDRGGFDEDHLPSLRTMTQAGGKLDPLLATRFAQSARARGWQLFIMYGQTEASPRMAFVPPEDALDFADTIGRPVPGGRLWLEDADGATITQTGIAGELVYEGPNVMMGYAATREELVLPAGLSRLKTGDIAEMLDNGYFRIVGRMSRFVKLLGLRVSLDEIETRLRAQGHRVIASGDDRGVVLFAQDARFEEAASRQELRNHVAALYDLPAGNVRVAYLAEAPLLSSGKVDYRALSESAAELLDSAPEAGSESFEELLERALGRPVDRSLSFTDMGGDSLAHVEINIVLERALDAAPAGWEWQPLGKLIAEVEQAGDFAALMTKEGGAPPLPDGSRNMNPSDISFWALVAEDFRTNDASVTHQGFLMLLVHRFGNLRMDVRPKLLRAPLSLLYRVLNKLTQILFGMKLDYTVKVGRRVKLEHFGSMILGAREIGNDVVLRQNTTCGLRSPEDRNAKPVIGDFVDIGAGAVIVGNVTIGRNSVIGANSVVYASVPPNSVVVGVPARIIGQNRRQNLSPIAFSRLARRGAR